MPARAARRARLGAAGFGVDRADNRCGTLSGGEKARLLLFLATFHGPHLLVLDEPTNHLDVDSREALIQALNTYPGAIIMISHDRHLIDACADRLWVVRAGTVEVFDGDLDAYQRQLLEDRSAQDPGRAGERATAPARTSRADERRAAAERRAEVAPLRRAMQKAEAEVERLSQAIAELDTALANPRLYETDADKAQSLSIERGPTWQGSGPGGGGLAGCDGSLRARRGRLVFRF